MSKGTFSSKRNKLNEEVISSFARKNDYHKEDTGPPTGVYVEPTLVVADQRERYVHQYKDHCVSTNVILNYNSIDQKGTCACSFVGFLNMCNIYKMMHGISLIPNDKMKKWQQIWNSFNVCTATDIAFTLDILATKNWAGKAIDRVEYIPIRSSGNSERGFNSTFWTTQLALFDKYPYAKTLFEKTPTKWDQWLFQIAYKIEDLIDRGIPIEINSQSHSRTCVAYDETTLLFADNYGNDYNVEYTDMENCYAGYCKVNKWLVYSTVRDICYLNPPNEISGGDYESEDNAPSQPKPQSKPKSKPKLPQSKPSKPPKQERSHPHKPEKVPPQKTCQWSTGDNYRKLTSVCVESRADRNVSIRDIKCNTRHKFLVEQMCKYLD